MIEQKHREGRFLNIPKRPIRSLAGAAREIYFRFADLSARRQWISGTPQAITYAETIALLDEQGYEGDARALCLEVIGAADHAWREAYMDKARSQAKT